jgi:hypothetical protein
MKTLFVALIFFVINGCATTHPGQIAVAINGDPSLPLKVSAQTNDADMDSPYQLIQVTLENKSDNWVHIVGAEVNTGAQTSGVSVVVGGDLLAWAEAMKASELVRRQNREAMQAGLLLLGGATAVAGAVSGNNAATLGGSAVFAGTTLWAVADELQTNRDTANGVAKTPSTHLYSATTLPPRLFLRRWLLLNKKPGTLVSKLVFTLETSESEKVTYAVSL